MLTHNLTQHKRFLSVVLLIAITSCSSTHLTSQPVSQSAELLSTEMNSEMRGVWVSTVLNLDWPSKPGLSSKELTSELESLFDSLKRSGFNAIFFQIRPESDALYRSSYEPWSFYLTGNQGFSPELEFDPLQTAIYLAHSRGMELHAWLNPFRTAREMGAYTLSDSHIVKRRPEWILSFKNRSTSYSMLNPGIPDVRSYIATVVGDIVRKYDVDGIHFDDYFYPYSPAITNEDQTHFRMDSRNFESIQDWRRDNIDRMIEQVRDTIQAIDPLVKYGVSPFAIRLNSDAGTNGSEGYHMIYADPLQWLKQGTIDYVAPQIYWEQLHPVAPYKPVMEFWSQVANEYNRHIYIGLAPYRLAPPHNWPVTEIGDMLELNRNAKHLVHGSIFFRAQHITQNLKGLRDRLSSDWFSTISRVPVMNWKPIDTPYPIEELEFTRASPTKVTLTWKNPGNARKIYIYRYPGKMAIDDIMKKGIDSYLIALTGTDSWVDTKLKSDESYLYAVTVAGRNSEESIPRLIYIE